MVLLGGLPWWRLGVRSWLVKSFSGRSIVGLWGRCVNSRVKWGWGLVKNSLGWGLHGWWVCVNWLW